MPEPTQILYSHKELTTILLKEKNIHEGYWALQVEFSFAASIAGTDEQSVVPTGLVGVSRIGIQESGKAFPLAVDASEVNPNPKADPKRLKK